jgi:MoaA/NifB/PqqE/SkfB family radical SAM enzyme
MDWRKSVMFTKQVIMPHHLSYIGVFLTFSCQLRCSYCNNFHGGDLLKSRKMSYENWIRGLNRIQTRPNLPITFQGGEPTAHKHFFEIVAGIDLGTPIDLLTNLEIDIEKFCKHIPPERMRRADGHSSIRVSYHHGQSNFEKLIKKVLEMNKRGYSINIQEVEHPDYRNEALARKERVTALGIDYSLKEFLGPWKGINYGTLRYKNAVNSEKLRFCDCRTSELLIAPDGNIFRCHSDLFADRLSIGNILDEKMPLLGKWRPCSMFGRCNSCDIRIQVKPWKPIGFSSVEIRNISDPYADNIPIVNVINGYGKV